MISLTPGLLVSCNFFFESCARSGSRAQLADGAHFDRALARRGDLRRDLDRLVEIGGVDEIEAGELLLRLGKRSVGDRQCAVADANGRGRLDRLERPGGAQLAVQAPGVAPALA